MSSSLLGLGHLVGYTAPPTGFWAASNHRLKYGIIDYLVPEKEAKETKRG